MGDSNDTSYVAVKMPADSGGSAADRDGVLAVLNNDDDDQKKSPTVVFIPENGKLDSAGGISPVNRLQTIDGAIMSFRDVCYDVQTKTHACACRKQLKPVLKNVSGIFRPGINAILGPTGSGKTSLLDILAGRKDSSQVNGDVFVDDRRQPRNFKYMSGYVIQDDIVMGMLTVRENIEFSAALRLPGDMTVSQRHDSVSELLTDLGLSKCADTKVGTEFVRGISGGERKRTNIAMELVTSPRVLFLDEPTTGLDANTAYSVMHLLHRLSRRGMTIIMSIHQPRYSIYKLFDNLMLLHDGECIYHGPAAETLDFFATANYICEEHNNPPDFFLDVLSGSVSEQPSELVPDDKTSNGGVCPMENGDKETSLLMSEVVEVCDDRRSRLLSHYAQSKWRQTLNTELQSCISDMEKPEDTSRMTALCQRRSYSLHRTSFCNQLCVVSRRTWNNMIRNRHALLTQMFSAVILGLIVGTIYFQICADCDSGIQNRIGAFFFIVMNYVFGNMSAVDIFIKERAIFIHETVSGYYRTSAYFFAKLFCDVIPQRVFPIVLFAVITYFMIGLQLSGERFAFYALNIMLTSVAGCSVALVFSASTRQHSIGTILTALVWVCMMVFSGLLVKVSTIPPFLRWLKWLSIFQYSMNAFMANELTGLTFCSTHLFNGTETMRCTTGDEYLTEQGIGHVTMWDLWSNEMALTLITVSFLTLTYIQLRRTGVTTK